MQHTSISLAHLAAACSVCHKNACVHVRANVCAHIQMHAHTPLSCAGRSRRPLMLCDCNPQGFFLHYWMSSPAFVLRHQGIPTFACFSHSLFAHLFPSQPPQRVCCMKVRLSSPRYPARDYDTTASNDNRTYCLEEPNEPI